MVPLSPKSGRFGEPWRTRSHAATKRRPLVVWASPAIRHGIVADDRPGPTSASSSESFQNLPGRAVREARSVSSRSHSRALSMPAANPAREAPRCIESAALRSGSIRSGPDVGKGLEDAHGVGCLPGAHGLSARRYMPPRGYVPSVSRLPPGPQHAPSAVALWPDDEHPRRMIRDSAVPRWVTGALHQYPATASSWKKLLVAP